MSARPPLARAATLPAGCAALLAGCATMNTARPLSPGQHALGVTLGGGLVELGAPIPLPNVVVEGRHGVAEPKGHPIDVGWGANLTALPFGVLAIHGGASGLLLHQAGARPALSVADRVWFATNALGLPAKTEPRLQGWVTDQVELTASWKTDHALPYLALAEYLDLGHPALTLTPAVGSAWDFRRPGGVVLQTELRWYGLGVPDDGATVDWVPGGTGVLGVSVGLSSRLGARREAR